MAAKPWLVRPLTLPVGDKEYTVQPVDYADGLTLISVGEGKSKQITGKSKDEELFRLVMGDTWDAMITDKQPYPVMFRAGMASMQYQMALVSGADPEAAVAAAESFWDSGMDPEAVAATLMAAYSQTANQPKTSTRSTSSASGRKTPSPASTRTTTSRRVTPRTASTAAGKPSRGKPSQASSR